MGVVMSEVVTASGKNKRQLTIVLAMTFSYLLVEVVGGVWTGSLALLADAGHMVTDVGGLALALFAIRMAERKPTSSKTFGYLRTEILAALVNAVVLFGISFYVLYEAYERFRNPPVVESLAMSGIAVVGLFINIVGVLILRSGSNESLNLKGAYFEVISDMLTSIGVVVAGAIMWFTGWYYADPIISAGIGLFILPRTWILMRDAVSVLLEATPDGTSLQDIRSELSSIEGVSKVHDLHVWSLTSGVNYLTAHLIRVPNGHLNEILTTANRVLKEKYSIGHSTIQVEDDGLLEDQIHE